MGTRSLYGGEVAYACSKLTEYRLEYIEGAAEFMAPDCVPAESADSDRYRPLFPPTIPGQLAHDRT